MISLHLVPIERLDPEKKAVNLYYRMSAKSLNLTKKHVLCGLNNKGARSSVKN
jgi:hypothetical protein